MKLVEGGASGIYFGDRLLRELPYYGVAGLQALGFALKIVFLCWLMMLIRWSLPRFRYDQIMHLGWKIMLPLSLINVAATAVWLAFF
jgi:NADH-quinone oxidoreductase subunit H